MNQEQTKSETDFQQIFQTVEKQTAEFIENVTETFYGKAESLRDGTELNSVELPRDLYAHRNAQTEWWYYTGHAETNSGKKFGFELVFFKRRTDLDKFNLIPLRVFGNPLYFAHFAITEQSEKSFQYSHCKSANNLWDLPAFMSEKHYYLRIGDWTIREVEETHILTASIGEKIKFEANLKPEKAVVLNGKNGQGVSFKDEGEASRYFSFTRMSVEGDIVLNGEVEHFTGSAWMDREFGTWTPTENQKGWDWFSIQLENKTEIMCYQLRNSLNEVSPFSSGTFVKEDGSFQHLTSDDFVIEPTGYWKSPGTSATYPSGWKIRFPKLEIELEVFPVMENQELDTRGTTMIVYWEGACEVKGTIKNVPINGRAYVELVGYDRSHDNPNLAYFLMGNSF